MYRPLALLLTTGAAGTVLFTAGPAAATDGPGFCPSYPTQAAAQEAFDAAGGSPVNNWRGLDPDHDGVVCEGHQFPGQTAPTPGPTAPDSPPPPWSPPGREPAYQEPSLPITGPGSPALYGTGASLLLAGAGLAAAARRRRT